MEIVIPPGFRPFDALAEVEIHTRNLPHWRQAGATYMVTFRLADALPKVAKEAIRQEILDFKRLHGKPDPGSPRWLQHHQRVTQRMERLLDEHHGSCVLRDPKAAASVQEAFENRNKIDYDLYAYVIMPNHCHLLVQPYEHVTLEKAIQAWKSVSARGIHRQQGTAGNLWQLEYFDRIVRDEAHYHKVVHYIITNPEKAGLNPAHVPTWVWEP